MSKVKSAEEDKWKHGTGPLTQSDLRLKEGEPRFSVFLGLPKSTQAKISHLMKCSTGVISHRVNCEACLL